MTEYLTPDEVANLLRVDRKTVYAAIRNGRLPALQLGRTFRVSRDDLQRLTVTPRNPPGGRHGSPAPARPAGQFTRLAKEISS